MQHQPETIQMIGEADDVLVALCQATRLGRGRVIAAALEFMMNAYLGEQGVPTIHQIVDRIGKARTMPDITHDAIEIAKLPK